MRAIIYLTICLLSGASFGQVNDLRMAVTVDDLPTVGWLSDQEVRDNITRQLISALQSYRVPAVGFVNEGKLYEDDALVEGRVNNLRAWATAGFELGNHGYSHEDLHRVDTQVFLDDVARGDRITRRILAEAGRKPRYFRHPYLHTGTSVETQSEVQRWLAERGYRVAPVTIDNAEYVYARAYDRLIAKGDAGGAESLAVEYVSYMQEMIEYYERQSGDLVGYRMPQVLLLHANRLNSVALTSLLGRLAARGYQFITLEEALRDPVYVLPDHYFGRGGISWIRRWALTLGRRGNFFAGEPEVPDQVWEIAEIAR